MDINQLMKQAQTMQKKMQEMQKEIADKTYEGKAGGELVKVWMSGSGEMQRISIDPSLIDKAEKDTLEDLIIAAHNHAKTQADEDSKNSMTGALGNLGGLASGLKF